MSALSSSAVHSLKYTRLLNDLVGASPNPKHVGTNYLKSDSQTLWSRNAAKPHAPSKTKHLAEDSGAATPTEVTVALTTVDSSNLIVNNFGKACIESHCHSPRLALDSDREGVRRHAILCSKCYRPQTSTSRTATQIRYRHLTTSKRSRARSCQHDRTSKRRRILG